MKFCGWAEVRAVLMNIVGKNMDFVFFRKLVTVLFNMIDEHGIQSKVTTATSQNTIVRQISESN